VEGSNAFACRYALIAASVAAVAAGGCGGGQRQDADEPSGTFQVAVLKASFPAKQHLAQPERFVIAVRNTGNRTVPNVAVTLSSFAARSEQAGLADPERAVWVIDASPPTPTRGPWAAWPPARPGASCGA
jgi:hypothetical protein